MEAGADAVALAWGALGRQLAASRRAAGLTQVALARSLNGHSRSTVANAETGHQHAPRSFWVQCDSVLGTGTALARGYDRVEALTRRACAQVAVAARQSSVDAGIGGLARDPLAADAVTPQPGAAGLESVRLRLSDALSSGAVSSTSLDAWEQAALHHAEAARYRPADDLLPGLGADLAELEAVIRGCHAPGSLRRLTRVAAQFSGLMCLQMVRLDDRDGFRRWARTARSAASEAGDQAVLSWVLAQEAYGHYYAGNLAEAVTVARHAQALMRRAPRAGAVLAAALEARAHAARGNTRETRRALGRAETILQALDPGSVMASAFGYAESQFRFHQSSAYTRLGDTRAALAAQERALAICPADDFTDRALTRLDRAACLAHDGNPTAAVAYATETLTRLTADQSEGIIALRAQELITALPPRVRLAPAVRELRELLPNPRKEAP